MTDWTDIAKGVADIKRDFLELDLFKNDLYGITVIGRFKLIIFNMISFKTGGCVVLYTLQEINGAESNISRKTILKAKQFFNDESKLDLMKQNEEYIVLGTLENDTYHDKKTLQWVNKGVYIKITRFQSVYIRQLISEYNDLDVLPPQSTIKKLILAEKDREKGLL